MKWVALFLLFLAGPAYADFSMLAVAHQLMRRLRNR
jgi:hypothetical protein